MIRKSDEEIRNEVLNAIAWDSRLATESIGATVKNGIVTLVGSVQNFAAKIAAEEAAHGVRGVLDVASDVEVKPTGALSRTDTDIAAAVRRALEWDALVDNEKIQSTVSSGCVTLTGTVKYLRERDDAQRVVEHLIGVRGVFNDIEVSGLGVEPTDVRHAIEGALVRHAERGAEHIGIDVEGSTVTLSGKVDSWSEKRAILGIVKHTRGVATVHDLLHVNPYSS